MCEPAHFGQLPHALGRDVVEVWLGAHSIAILDRAHCCKESRIRFSDLVDGTCLRNVVPSGRRGRVGEIWNAASLIRWLRKMNMAVESFVIPCSLLLAERESLLRWMEQVGRDVMSVCFEPDWRISRRRFDKVFNDVAKCFRDVTSVDVSNLTIDDTDRRNASNQGLRTLLQAYSLHKIIAPGAGLTDETAAAIAQHCPNLMHLDLRDCSGLTSLAISAIAQSCSALVYLDINGTQASDNTVASIVEHCRLLKHLDIANTNTSAGLVDAEFIRGCPELTSLSCHTSDDDLRAISAGYPNLEALVSPNSRAGDDDVTALAASCRRLRELDLLSNWRISYFGLRAIAWHCGSLQVLGLLNCTGVDDDGIAAATSELLHQSD
jgi:hypothetical protein